MNNSKIKNENLSDNKFDGTKLKKSTSTSKYLATIKKEVSCFSYQESIEALDKILDLLQNEAIALEEIEKYYLKANLCLEHCQKLLETVEHNVVQLLPDELTF